MGERWILYVLLCDYGAEYKAETTIKDKGSLNIGNRPKLSEPRDLFHQRGRKSSVTRA